MGDEQEPGGPSLEPPSLFRRKRKDKAAPRVEDDSPTTILDDVTATEPTQPLAAPVPATPDAPPPLFADEAVPPRAAVEPTGTTQTEGPPVPDAGRPERTGPVLPGRVGAAVAGVLVGALIVGLTSASFELCSRIQGTSSCGGPGLFLLVAILVLAVLLGSAVLRLCAVPEPGSTSFLAVGLTSVIALLFLVDALFEWWMVIAIPLVSVLTFLLSHWVTTTFVEPAKD